MKKSKRGQFWGTMTPWIIGITVLVLMLLFAYLMRDRLSDYADAIRRLFRGGS